MELLNKFPVIIAIFAKNKLSILRKKEVYLNWFREWMHGPYGVVDSNILNYYGFLKK